MTPEQRDRVGVVVNTGGGGIEQIIDGTHVHDQKGPRFVSPFAVPALSGSMGACMLSIEFGLTGPVITQVAACATSVIAFHDALRLIREGECDVVLAGGTEAPVWPMGVAALANMTALSKRNDDPATASRPFDETRDGFVLGEGGGVVVVESLAHAQARGRDAHRRGPRRRPDRRRVPHQRPGADRPRPDAGDDATPCATARSRPTRSTTSSPTAPRRRSTTRPRRGRSRRPTATTPTRSRSARPSR